jgi:CubicO group peptidase (beta-lactamase class C family)
MIRFFLTAALFVATWAYADATDDLVRASMTKQHIPGISIAVVKEGKVIKSQGYGFSNIERKIPATPQTIYQLASVSKQFVAAGTMLLVEQGKIKLDEPVSTYLQNIPAGWSNVTVRRLLSHTAGLKRDDGLGFFSAPTDKELLEAICTMPLDAQPGEKWSYSNAGYNLMSFALAEQTQESWDKYLHDKIFVPLHMNETRRIPDSRPGTNFAVGYFTNSATGWRRAPVVRRTFASGGLVSTVLDLAKWDAALYGEQVLKHSTFEQLITPVKLNTGDAAKVKNGAGYGFGWSVGSIRGHKTMSHNGSRPGFSTYIIRFYEDKLTVIVLANEWRVDVSTLGRQVGLRYLE